MLAQAGSQISPHYPHTAFQHFQVFSCHFHSHSLYVPRLPLQFLFALAGQLWFIISRYSTPDQGMILMLLWHSTSQPFIHTLIIMC